MTQVLDRILVPLADEKDAADTAESLTTWFHEGDREQNQTVTMLHVVEKSGGAVDKAPLPAAEQRAADIFEIATVILEDEGYSVETEVRYGTNIVETIIEAARELNSTVVVFRPREYGILTRLVSRDRTRTLIRNLSCPAIVLPVE